jgi:hypothetical protein
MKKDCKNCIYLDEYFGDCCHPLSEGCKDLAWALRECGEKRKYKVTKNEKANKAKEDKYM